MSLFEQSIPINSEEFDIKKYMNQDNIKNITYDEILQDVNKFKLSGVPLIDMICVKNFGDFLNKKFNGEKWDICPNLIQEIYTELNTKLPSCNIEYINIEQYINKLRKNSDDPEGIDSKIDKYMTDYLRSRYWLDKSNQENIEIYFMSKGIVNNIMKEIKDKYICEWNEIEQKSEHIQNILSEKFDNIEEDERYIVSEMLLEKINNDACKYINPIRENTVEKIKSEYQKYVVLDSVHKLHYFNKDYNKLQNEFKQEIEKVYEKVLVENKIDKHIMPQMLELFVLERSMHMFSLSLDLTELTLSQLK